MSVLPKYSIGVGDRFAHQGPAQLAADILKKEQRIAELMGNIQKLLAQENS